MSDEEGLQEQEKDPGHKKKASLAALLLIFLLCFSLILSVFIGRQKNNSSQNNKRPADSKSETDSKSSEQEFAEAVEKKQRRLQKKADRQKTKDEKDQGQQSDGHNDKQSNSIEDKFKAAEIDRALKARVSSGFNLTDIKDTGFEEKEEDVEPLDDIESIKKKREKIIDEIKRVKQKIAETQAGILPGSKSVDPNLAAATDEDETDQEKTIGRPASESSRKPGQRLIPTGTVISGVLDQTLISDYTGPFRALISDDVYDSSGNYIVIPKGCKVIGKSVRASGVNEPIQNRMGLTVRWIILPDGKRISFERSAALDHAGVPAIKDEVTYHFFAQFMGVVAYAILSSETTYEGSGGYTDETYEGNLSESMRKQFSPLATKYLNIVPTITLSIGTPLKIFLEDDIYAYPWASLGEKIYNADRSLGAVN